MKVDRCELNGGFHRWVYDTKEIRYHGSAYEEVLVFYHCIQCGEVKTAREEL